MANVTVTPTRITLVTVTRKGSKVSRTFAFYSDSGKPCPCFYRRGGRSYSAARRAVIKAYGESAVYALFGKDWLRNAIQD